MLSSLSCRRTRFGSSSAEPATDPLPCCQTDNCVGITESQQGFKPVPYALCSRQWQRWQCHPRPCIAEVPTGGMHCWGPTRLLQPHNQTQTLSIYLWLAEQTATSTAADQKGHLTRGEWMTMELPYPVVEGHVNGTQKIRTSLLCCKRAKPPSRPRSTWNPCNTTTKVELPVLSMSDSFCSLDSLLKP